MLIKIISDGTPSGTRIVSAETGDVIEGVCKATIVLSPHNVPTAVLEFNNFKTHITAREESRKNG